MCDLERSFELDRVRDFNFGDMETANSFQKKFSTDENEFGVSLKPSC